MQKSCVLAALPTLSLQPLFYPGSNSMGVGVLVPQVPSYLKSFVYNLIQSKMGYLLLVSQSLCLATVSIHTCLATPRCPRDFTATSKTSREMMDYNPWQTNTLIPHSVQQGLLQFKSCQPGVDRSAGSGLALIQKELASAHCTELRRRRRYFDQLLLEPLKFLVQPV